MNENTKQTLVAFIRLACMLIAAGATMFGLAIDAESLYIIVGMAASLVSGVWAWWKNNNVTAAATEAQEFYDLFKANNEETLDIEGE